jgi:hypothetical protein
MVKNKIPLQSATFRGTGARKEALGYSKLMRGFGFKTYVRKGKTATKGSPFGAAGTIWNVFEKKKK